MNRETGGVVLAFAGFVFLVGAFKGTWRNTIDALLGNAPAAGGVPTSSGAPTRPAGSGFPGTSVLPNPKAQPAREAPGLTR